jgi:spore coat protein CotH
MKKLPVIILCCVLAATQISFSQNAAGDSIFNSSQIHTVKFYFSQAKWYDSLIAYKPLDKKMKGNVMIDGKMYSSVGVQFKGNSSFNNASKKKSWKIDFNEFDSTQECNKENTLNLNNGFKDPTMLREKIALDFCVRNGIAAPRCTYANIYVNDTLWGLYTIVEQIDKTFLKHWYHDNDGNLFKGDPSGSLQWYGSSVASYNTKYELKTNKTQNNWSDLIHLVDKINNTPAANFHDSLDAVLETNSAINTWAANILFANLDSYQGSGHNYYIFHDSTNNKFNWISWDVNESFGNFSQGMSIAQMESLSIFYISTPTTNRPLEVKMLADATYKSAYVWALCNMVATDFDSTFINPRIDSLANAIRASVYADPNKFYTNVQFETNLSSNITSGFNIPGLKSFLANRRTSVLTELAANGCFMGTEEHQAQSSMFQVYPNPNNGQFTITGEKFPVQVQVYNSLGQMINQTTVNKRQEIVTLHQTKGIYFYMIRSDNSVFGTGKLIIE